LRNRRGALSLGRGVERIDPGMLDQMGAGELETLLQQALDPKVPVRAFYAVLNRVIARTAAAPYETERSEHESVPEVLP
jgi:hypothetical protein